MAQYKYPQVLTQNHHQAFDDLHGPGTAVPYSGIYKCQGCAAEIAANHGDPLPPQNRHQHTQGQGAIQWRLIVATQ
ncbi:hypothetical protein [Achromobacter ruhlandii]|uniref:hypothetical protein n=1 Tax=Achromobacter ruhlandii TaxID=72557 RepID=UPI001EED2A47|nr:hypothetical protein [Achromobacter ruhlandii]